MRDHIALYGNVAIPRAFCQECNGYAFVIDGAMACCGVRHEFEGTRTERLSLTPEVRRELPKFQRENILREQDYRCLYCNKRFGSTIYIGGRSYGIRINWDHKVPFVFTHDNRIKNIAASCQFCNRWKGSLMFHSIEEIQVYVHQKWEQKRASSRKGVLVLSPEVSTSPPE